MQDRTSIVTTKTTEMKHTAGEKNVHQENTWNSNNLLSQRTKLRRKKKTGMSGKIKITTITMVNGERT